MSPAPTTETRADAQGLCKPEESQDGPLASYAQATELKSSANDAFKAKRWQDAIQLYESAVEALFDAEDCSIDDGRDLLVTVHANLAQCHLNVKSFQSAVVSATECLRLDPSNEKALFRRAMAHEGLADFKLALVDLGLMLKNNPHHTEATHLHSTLISRESSALAMNDAPAWFVGLAARDRYEWFVDCYRLRLHADCTENGAECGLRGIYLPNATTDAVIEDWLVFCKLAALCDILPKDWSWQGSLEVASQPLGSLWGTDAADRSIASEKLELMRTVAERIYGDETRTAVTHEVLRRAGKDAVSSKLVADLGGSEAWRRLLKRLPDPAEARAALEAAEMAEFDEDFGSNGFDHAGAVPDEEIEISDIEENS